MELSRREKEVLSMPCAGKAIKEVGAKQGVSPEAISTLIHRAKIKNACDTTVQLAAEYARWRAEIERG